MEGAVGFKVWDGFRMPASTNKIPILVGRNLHKVCMEGEGVGWFHQQVVSKVGRGDKVRFWEEVWASNSSFKTLFPRLYSISLNQGQKVEEVGS